jgi:hypothetical protein
MTNLRRIKLIMFGMFLDGNLPKMEMNEIQPMWEVLLEINKIKYNEQDWKTFMLNINCKASNNWVFFSKTFDEFIKIEKI